MPGVHFTYTFLPGADRFAILHFVSKLKYFRPYQTSFYNQ